MSTSNLKQDLENMSVKQLQIFYNDVTKSNNVVFNPKNKRQALIKCLALVDSTLAKKAPETKKKAAAVKPKVSADKKETIGSFILERVNAGMSNNDILEDLRKAFPMSTSTAKDISWLKWKQKQPKTSLRKTVKLS